MCKHMKNLPIQIQGGVGFSGFRGRGFDKGRGNSGGLRPPSELWISLIRRLTLIGKLTLIAKLMLLVIMPSIYTYQ